MSAMPSIRKQLIVVGDRLLVRPAEGEERTQTGLVLPASAMQDQQVRQGRVVKVGPGIPVPDPGDFDEPWKKKQDEPRYVPLQAREGDTALFLKKASVEIRFEGERYLIVPTGAVLMLIREDIDLGDTLGQFDDPGPRN